MGFGLKDIISPITDVVGGFMEQEENLKDRNQQDEHAALNWAHQKEMAKHGIRWRVEDAKKAGLHPLAALGASAPNYSPSMSVGQPDNSMSNMVRDMGQDVSRAVAATQTREERLANELRLQNMKLQNDLLGMDVESKRRILSETGPSLPSHTNDPYLGGQGDISKAVGGDPRVVDAPLLRTVSDPKHGAKEAGAITDFQVVRSGTGYAIVPAAEVKQRIEDDFLAEQQWKVRNYSAVFGGSIRLPDGTRAVVNPLSGELLPVPLMKKYGKRLWKRFLRGGRG